ncbi:hypothetical protein AAIB33_00855 [Microbacterium sp. AZCO]|uniref:hypothetical protein n=1 Tax=Microbacterium sp. AZCO TaxID=3142976 RepID=UPI0031F38508
MRSTRSESWAARQALRAAQPHAESRSTAWYLIARSAALSIASLVGGLGLSWGGVPDGGLDLWVSAENVLVHVLDVPVWLSRGRQSWAVVAVVCPVLVLTLVGAPLFQA